MANGRLGLFMAVLVVSITCLFFYDADRNVPSASAPIGTQSAVVDERSGVSLQKYFAAKLAEVTMVASVQSAQSFMDDPATISLAQDMGITREEAAERIAWQDRVPALVERANAEFANRYGGVWIDNRDGGRIKLGVVDANESDASKSARAIAASNLTAATDVVTVQFGEQELFAANEWIAGRIASANTSATLTLSAGITTDRNRVELTLPSGTELTPKQSQLVTEAMTRHGNMIEIAYSDASLRQMSCVGTDCDEVLRGGVRIMSREGSICTAGFNARQIKQDGSDIPLLLTAGHCLEKTPSGSAWTYYVPDAEHDGFLWGRSIGTVAMFSFLNNDRGEDWGALRVEPINAKPVAPQSNWVLVTDARGTKYDERYPIRASGWSVVGMRICMTGSTSGSHCGSVTRIGLTVTTAEGHTLRNMGDSDICGAQKGDSGGPLFARNTAYGLYSAGIDCRAVYQGVKALERNQRIYIRTQ